MITFHDWHPVNIQEYGIAAPDPRDPDMVYGSSRTNVSLYNRKTGQSTNVGPDMGGRGGLYSRNVRTMPILWSPVDRDLLYYCSNAVWKTSDRGHTWTRISPDLARQTWEIPPTAGKYASGVQVSPQGTITAFSASPLDVNVLWAGTDDGNIQVTMDGGADWSNVTPPAIKAWTRIFNMDAGHFDKGTAYAAANTMRIDDMNPHFWRTHDGGKTWTEIDAGIAPGAVANSIREDPRQRGLLYASTDTQVWVSFDDGDHWQSLRLDMPAVSVRDIQVKDDDSCLCSDLVAATHGRGFWILDDVTPLRQAAAARAAQQAYLFKPATAVRVRYGMNDPTEWPPELPHGENPPPGGIIDYYLAADVSSPVALDVLDAKGTVIRSYSSNDPVLDPDPAVDTKKYDAICQENPSATDCRQPLYWPAPQMVLSTHKGMHRFSWDLHLQPFGAPSVAASGSGAVPGHTYPSVQSPWAPPGEYTVRLTVDGKTYNQPLSLRLDPRVTAQKTDLTQLFSLTREMYDGAVDANTAYARARQLVDDLTAAGGDDASAFKTQVEAIAPAPPAGGRGGRGGRGGGGGFGGRGGRGGRGGGGAATPTLQSVSGAMMSAAMSMQDAEVPPTAREIAACDTARQESQSVMAQWKQLSTTGLDQLNAKRAAAGLPPIRIK